MPMTRRMVREVSKGRELLWFLLDGKRCCFCNKLLLEKPFRNIRFGNATAPPLNLDITLHHNDGDHDNNGKFGNRKNLRLSHESCHKRFHGSEVFRAWRAA
jgi:hypothetical protein